LNLETAKERSCLDQPFLKVERYYMFKIIPESSCNLKNPTIIEVIPHSHHHQHYSLGERDNYIKRIENQMNEKRQLLINQREYLNRTVEENEYLEGVRNDYKQYNNIIIKQKEDQIKAMEILNRYIEDLKISGKLTEHDIGETRREQREIMDEIDIVKKSLNELI
jgi:hypothetical protein